MTQRVDKLDLILGCVVVGAATVAGWYYTLNDPESWAQVVILGVTALVVVCYAHQARRMADETQHLAKSTQELARSTRDLAIAAWRPNIVLSAEHEEHLQEHRNRIFNYGPGPAHGVWIVANHPDSPKLLSHHVPPVQPVHIPDEAKALLKWPVARKDEHISLFWLDATGQEYALKFHFTSNQWVPAGEPPSPDWDVWRGVRNSAS